MGQLSGLGSADGNGGVTVFGVPPITHIGGGVLRLY